MSGAALPGASRLRISGAGLSHRGLVREVNEDALLTDPTGVLWAVADGMGGHGHGDLAADLTVDALARLPHGDAGRDELDRALREAHADVRARARRDGLGEIGATVVALMIQGARAIVAWAGDSRAYLLRDGALSRITRDHSLVQELVDQGALDPAEADHHPQSNVVTRAIGSGAEATPEFTDLELRGGDGLLLCSDGLTRCAGEPEIAGLMAAAPDPERACQALVELALTRGAPDNVSVVVVRVAEA
ncbi:PP2C family protein-serine/threonine phosphatase [Amaricoccus solimangrovi]|uniref:Serine/threonine-protein phosphatase n=1 Tax=Amaricoccus solimangrovi TaxID=2589815 RepID=A0A501WMJ0_9RHOB|nr:protein phosphatase 2C domain-containing protein [Amaricoccus solimangrovi]TPE48201.1 serine/threonine-protein phosphatase [Amaricoccus solimangrovi]